jgi:methylmalonyl-CoA/ethylmalonyl-CoA epimerase
LINQSPKKGADNKLIAFLHPKSSNRVLIELCQDIDD